MDEKLSRLIKEVNNQVNPAEIPYTGLLFLQIFKEKIKKKIYPPASCFGYVPEDENDGLSTDWEQFSTPEFSLTILSKTFRFGKQEFKDAGHFFIYSIENSFLSNLEGVKLLRHAPVFNGDPPPTGSPNNPAHSVVIYEDVDSVEIRLKLQTHVKKMEVDMELVKEISNSI